MTDRLVTEVDDALCLRIIIGEDARVHGAAATTGHHGPAWEAILTHLLDHAVWGATALRGVGGYGPHGHMHHVRHLATRAEALPIVIEAIDRPGKILPLLPELALISPDAFIATFPVQVHRHLHAALD